jgi:hypothetical protein
MLNEGRVRQLTFDSAIGNNGMAARGQHRERGLWRFLTWSFFLSQLAAGNAFAGGAAHAGNAIDLNAPDGGANGGAAGVGGVASFDFRPIGIDEQSMATPTSGAAQANSGPTIVDVKSGTIEMQDGNGDAASTVQVVLSGGDVALEGSPVVAGDPAVGGPVPGMPPNVDVVIESPPTLLDIDLPNLGCVLPPVLETVDNLIESLGPTLDGLLVPVVATIEDLAGTLGQTLDHVLSPVENVMDGLVGGLAPTLDPLLAPVAAIADGVGELIEPVGQMAGEIMALADPITDLAEPLLAPVMNVVEATQPILAPVLDAAAPVVDLVEPVIHPLLQPLAPVAEPVLDLLPQNLGHGGLLGGLFAGGETGEAGALAVSGALEFEAEANLAGYELFEAGGYTEFGLALHETAADSEPGTGDLVANIGAAVTTMIGDDASDDNGLPSLITHLQHEVALRGLGEGLM